MSNPKVFEFAKEVGMTPLALMDKIREWQLPVKSHMAELDNEMLATIKTRLSASEKSSEAEKSSEKKSTPRKKAATPSSVVKSTAVKSTVVKATPSKAAAKTEEKVAPATPKSTTTVRRRVKSEEINQESPEVSSKIETSTVVGSIKSEISVDKVAVVEKIESQPLSEAVSEKTNIVIPEVSGAPQTPAPVQSGRATIISRPAVVKPPESAPVKAVNQSPVVEKKTQTEVKSSQNSSSVNNNTTSVSNQSQIQKTVVQPAAGSPMQTNSSPSTQGPTPSNVGIPARKKEVSIGQSGVASAAAPRRNIIGRMDLSRVQSQAPPRPQGGYERGPRPQGSQGGGGYQGGGYQGGGNSGPGGANRHKGNIRPGFVQAATPPPVIDFGTGTDFGRKKDEKRRNKPGIGAEPTAVRPAEEEENQHFDAAEFRKREMVFQPKKKKGLLNRPSMQTQITTPKASKRVVKVNNTMKVVDLAMSMGVKAPELIKKLMKDGVMASMSTDLDFDTISLVVGDFGFEAINEFKTAEEIISQVAITENIGEAVTRPPVVTIMGHVDHGKTSLLDAIRNANVAAGEAGGITQHIGAYQVKTEGGHVITFLDTPGHEAFTAMRARGANVTDIVVIVVAADDGVMPQTAEAINHAKAANVPMIVAVNKMDKPGANPDRIKQQLTEFEVVPEEWGGSTIFVPVSAIKRTGIPELLEQIHLLAEVGEFKANPNKLGSGSVIEAKLEKGRGNVATILVKEGTVKVGQYIVAGTVSGRVKSLTNDKGEKIQSAGPGMPVEVLGLDGTPLAGDRFDIVKDESVIEDVIRVRKEQIDKANSASTKISLEDIFSKVKQGDVKELSVVLKTDVSGSLEAVNGMFKKLSTPEVKLKVVHSAVGGITESDVLLAQTAKGIIVGFNVRPDGGATTASKRMGVEIRSYTIVYELIDDIKKAMAGLLAPTIVEKVLGRAEVRNTFVVPKIGTIAGCFVADGKILRNSMARLIREGKIVYEGKVSSLKRFKDDAREVAQGFECGIGIENYNDIKVGDSIESFIKEEIARELSAPIQS